MASTRAQSVAEVLWELKQAEKLATLSNVARRAGFSPGSNGKTILNVLDGVRREWPHLQWWRVVSDDGTLTNEDQANYLKKAGIKVSAEKKGKPAVLVEETLIMVWTDEDNSASSASPVAETH